MSTVVLALALAVIACSSDIAWTLPTPASGSTCGQESSSQSPRGMGQSDPGGTGGVDTITGTISKDGKRFKSDDGQEWSITNRNLVKGHYGDRVEMKARKHKPQGNITVESLEKKAGNSNSSKQ